MKEKIIFTLLFMCLFVLVSTSQINDLKLSDKSIKLAKNDSIKEMEKWMLFCKRNPEVCGLRISKPQKPDPPYPLPDPEGPYPQPPILTNTRIVNSPHIQLIKNYNHFNANVNKIKPHKLK